jgi:hypothetical protein
MVALPDGTYFIANGALQGVAGFGLAENPNLSALLYDPSQPIGSRISILNTTIVARMYHSEATLLPDGRILLSGSDPETKNTDETVKYPQEYRVEVCNSIHSPSRPFKCCPMLGLYTPVSQSRIHPTHIYDHYDRLDVRAAVYHFQCSIIPGDDR